MIIGLKYGQTDLNDKTAKDKTYPLAREFMTRFQAKHNSLICKDLLGCDISTPDGFKQAHDQKLTTTLCPEFVRDAASILEDLIQ